MAQRQRPQDEGAAEATGGEQTGRVARRRDAIIEAEVTLRESVDSMKQAIADFEALSRSAFDFARG